MQPPWKYSLGRLKEYQEKYLKINEADINKHSMQKSFKPQENKFYVDYRNIRKIFLK